MTPSPGDDPITFYSVQIKVAQGISYPNTAAPQVCLCLSISFSFSLPSSHFLYVLSGFLSVTVERPCCEPFCSAASSIKGLNTDHTDHRCRPTHGHGRHLGSREQSRFSSAQRSTGDSSLSSPRQSRKPQDLSINLITPDRSSILPTCQVLRHRLDAEEIGLRGRLYRSLPSSPLCVEPVA